MTETNAAATVAPAKSHPICKSCGSDDVVKDAWASWNPEAGLWELLNVFDDGFCRACEESAEFEWLEVPATEAPIDKTAEIRRLNDALRRGEGEDGMIVVTAGLRAMDQEFLAEAASAVATFDGFSEENDPHGEHDFGALTVQCEKLLFKIDLYENPDVKMADGSPVVMRVLTIMLAEEY